MSTPARNSLTGQRVRRVNAGTGHSYKTADGRRLLGVTTALKPADDSGGLIGWTHST